jgi:xanthine dehydrogenase small subunit
MLACNAPVYTAKTLSEALQLRADHPEAVPLAGGTDVMVFLEADRLDAPAFLNLWGCDGLQGISEDGRRIGALCTWAEIREHHSLPTALRACARTVGAAQIQARGTVGGNIANASPAGDSLPLWLALDARFTLQSLRGRREVAAADFFLGYRKTAMAPDELLVDIQLPAPNGELYYKKVGTRLAQAISKVVLGASIRVDGGIVRSLRVALGAVAPVPLRCRALEEAMVGGPVRPELASLVQQDIRPIDDVRSSAHYRARVAENIVRTWLTSVQNG